MSRSLTLCIAVCVPISLFSQIKDVPTFGKIDKTELESKQCSYDPDADAEMIANVATYSLEIINDRLVSTLHCQVRLKILTDRGLSYANVRLPYYNNHDDEKISNLVANTFNLDGSGNVTTTHLEKATIYTRKVNAYRSQKVFALPEVKVGSVIEYKYVVNSATLKTWYFQKDVAVRYSRFTVQVPSLLEMYLRPLCTFPYESKDESTTRETIKTMAMKNIPGLRDEPFMSCEDDYLQKVDAWPLAYTVGGIRYPLIKSWKDAATELIDDESFGVQLKKSIPHTADLDAALLKITDEYQKMVTIHHYVRSKMDWDGEENFFALSGVKSAWKDHKGTSGEINLILINLLKDAHLHAYPMMVSTHDNGVLRSAFADINAFNKVVALVMIGDKQYILDGTDRFTPSFVIPENILNTEGLVLDATKENKYWWVSLLDSSRRLNDVIGVQGWVGTDGSITGSVQVRSTDYSRINRYRALKLDQSKYLATFCSAGQNNLRVDSLHVEDESNDSTALLQTFKFQMPVASSGDYTYFSVNALLGMSRNPFVNDNRFSDVFFGNCQSRTLLSSITIPEGYEFDELPRNVRLTMEDKSLVVTRMLVGSDGVLNARITIEFKRPFYLAAEYPMLKEFYKKMYTLLDEQIVIKKTP